MIAAIPNIPSSSSSTSIHHLISKYPNPNITHSLYSFLSPLYKPSFNPVFSFHHQFHSLYYSLCIRSLPLLYFARVSTFSLLNGFWCVKIGPFDRQLLCVHFNFSFCSCCWLLFIDLIGLMCVHKAVFASILGILLCL